MTDISTRADQRSRRRPAVAATRQSRGNSAVRRLRYAGEVDRAQLQLSVAPSGDETVVTVSGELDMSTAEQLSETVNDQLRGEPRPDRAGPRPTSRSVTHWASARWSC